MINIGNKMKEYRENSNQSQSELAKATGIKQQNISRWENNMNIPNIMDCITLANYFGITIDQLVGRSVDETNLTISHNELTKIESDLLSIFRTLTPKDQSRVFGIVRAYAG